jgi:hypothetical protein
MEEEEADMERECVRCQAPLEPGFVDVQYQGAERRLTVRLRNVPAPMCSRCHKPVVSPEAYERLLFLGMGPGNGWNVKVKPSDTDAA